LGPQQQQELLAALGRAYPAQQTANPNLLAIMPPSYPVQPPTTRCVYHVEQPDDEESGVYMTNDIERVYLSGTNDEKYIIVDTGSA